MKINIFQRFLKKYRIIALEDQLNQYYGMIQWYQTKAIELKEKIKKLKGE